MTRAKKYFIITTPHLAVGSKVDGGLGGGESVHVGEVLLDLADQGVVGALLLGGNLGGQAGEVHHGLGYSGGHGSANTRKGQ